MHHRQDIDGLRALAVLPVVLYHAGVPGFSGGFTGVDVFFVISGFLITKMIADDLSGGRFSIAEFYARRVRRIVPALAVVLLAVTLCGLIVFTPQELARYGTTLAMASLFSANVYFWQTSNYFSAEAEPSPLLHTWSLAVEEQFYIFWPLGLMLVFWLGFKTHLRWLPLLGLVAAIAASFILVRMNAQFSFYMLPTRAWELLLGASIALGCWPLLTGRAAAVASGAGLLAVLAAVFLLDASTETPGPWLLLPCIGAALILHAGQTQATLMARVLSLPPMVWFGLISYSLYLWHWPLIILPQLVLARALTGLEIAVAIAASIGLAALTWAYVETPFRRMSLTPKGMITRFNAVGVFALGLMAAIGLSLTNAEGLPQRANTAALAADAKGKPMPPPPCLTRERPSGTDDELPPLKPCLLGRGSERAYQAVLWGDSHANHLREALDDWGKANGITIRQVSKALCPPLLDTWPTVAPRNTRDDCFAFNRQVIHAIESSPEIRQVILAARWPHYTGDSVPRHGLTPLLAGERRVPTGPDDARKVLAEALTETVQALTQRGINVIVIDPLPDYFQSPAKCVARAAMLGLETHHCSVSFGSVWQRTGPITQIMRSLAASDPKVTVIETLAVLCPDDQCNPWQGGTLLFRDDNHVTAAGAAKIIEKLPAP